VRKRPLNKKELSKGEVDVATCVNGNTVLIREPKYGAAVVDELNE
jgi:hypothetical protein